MSFSFDFAPDSLVELARNSRESQATEIDYITFNTTTGELSLCRTSGSYGSHYTAINLYENSEPSWKYAVGSENVDALLALRAFGLSGDYEPMQINFATYSSSKLVNWIHSKTYPYGSDTVKPYDAFVEAVKAGLNNRFTNGATADESIDQFLYGDRDLNYYPMSVIIADALVGANGNDTILGLLGNDVIAGRDGNDDLYGGYGDDSLRGEAGNDFLYGEQNADRLFGGDGNDYLDGGLGIDYMSGGRGNDTYLVDNKNDVIEDKGAAADVDTVLIPTYVSYTLPTNVENGTLQGNDDSTLIGNGLSNKLKGNNGDNSLGGAAGNDQISGGDGDDRISGGAGRDKLSGGNGDDVFVFRDKPSASTIDTITDFSVKDDVILLDVDMFKTGKVGDLATAAFYVGAKAHDVTDRIIYDKTTGKLWYDFDGTGSAKAVQFALLDKGLSLTAIDFDLIA